MKIFAVWGKLEIKNRPKWLVDFMKGSNYGYNFHITFKQPCFINENRADDVKNILSDLFTRLKYHDHKIEVIFDKISPDKNYKSVMIGVTNCPELVDLQKNIINALKDYRNYHKPHHEEYEINFKPHLTIASDLDKSAYSEALGKIPANFKIAGIIKEVVLAIVKEVSPAESKNPNNLHIFNL